MNADLGVPSVGVDDYLGAFKATQHLIDQGCTSIAHIAGQQHVPIFKQRLNGYMDALKKNGFSIREELIRYGKVTIESGMECMNDLLRIKDLPDGIFAVEDFTALGAVQALKAANKKIPDEIAIIGFANESFGEYITPSLSTVDQQTIKMGEAAARLFFELSGEKTFYKPNPRQRILEPVLVFRDSSLRKRI